MVVQVSTGGVETQVGDSYSGVISLDLRNLNQVIEIDRVEVPEYKQAFGSDLEAILKETLH